MSNSATNSKPPDQLQREQALDPARSVLVQAPAGSGKTDLLTRRFLRLLSEVDEPGQIVAITFTIAAAAEMRHRILSELEKAAANKEPLAPDPDEFSMPYLARRALHQSNLRGWKLLDLPAQLRISTIDSFCRDLALQQPLLSGLGGGLAIAEQPGDLYRRAALHTIEHIGEPGIPALSHAIEQLLKWRDNNWQELEDLIIDMLSKRDRWMHSFVLSRTPDWEALRHLLERPFANAVHNALTHVSQLLDQIPGALEEALHLARFACSQTGGQLHRELAELADFPNAPFPTLDALEEAHQALLGLANLLLTGDCAFRRQIDKRLGFPADRKPEKARIFELIARLGVVPGLESSLAGVRDLPPARYTEDDWEIVRACFTLLRHAAAQLKVAFAEAAAVDFIEVAQIAESVLMSDDGSPTDAALTIADGIHHLLVDEFQDTSRRQHQLLAGLIAAWPDRTGRTCFLVGDPMQSIYFFREADAELFTRVKEIGLEIPNSDPLIFDFVPLSANFRTTPSLVGRLNKMFAQVFAEDDGSGIRFTPAEAARPVQSSQDHNLKLNIIFSPQITDNKIEDETIQRAEDSPDDIQAREILGLIHSHQSHMEEARSAGKMYRIAILARTRRSLTLIAKTLREAAIPFRAVDLEKLAARPEVLDALALARALLNPYDRVSWLGVLRAPWCGLTLEDLYILTSADDSELLSRPVPDLLAERLTLLNDAGSSAAARVLSSLKSASLLRVNRLTTSLGTWLQQVWLSLGGADCCDPTARANLDLLWTCLDRLPVGEQDLLGPVLHTALDKLTALPDPLASTDFGVQLMTIHKSKGLEFEVVIVPDLQAKSRTSARKLLSWLERGLKPETSSDLDVSDLEDNITEFLVAPLPLKGENSGKSKAWVDRIYRERESEEARRILYVAASRAREELHLFARPAFKIEASGDLSLIDPYGSLLATAWPALEEEIRTRFDHWKSTRQPVIGRTEPETQDEAEIEFPAEAAEGSLFAVPSAAPPRSKPTLLRRLPTNYAPEKLPGFAASTAGSALSGMGAYQLYTRHEGGLISRALGSAVHTAFEELARLRAKHDWQTVRANVQQIQPRMAAQVREAGIAPSQAVQIAANALQLALSASLDPAGEWILSPHLEAASEVRWTGVVGKALTSVRVDRVFRAGLTPGAEGQDVWWIIDYKTAHVDNLVPSQALAQLRPLFASQLESYAHVLRNLHRGDAVIRAGLYYPRMLLLDWWKI
jgi:ATP-dependent helicase/nuclease subunit A